MDETENSPVVFKNMPSDIAAAIIEIMGEVQKLQKSEHNQHGNYDFASIDAFLNAMRPLCAGKGLAILADEVDEEMIISGEKEYKGNKTIQYQTRVKYHVYLMHKSGAMAGPVSRHVTLPYIGAQTSGSAQSYMLKQFMRGLFQIATGDKDDPDFRAPYGEEEGRSQGKNEQRPNRNAPPSNPEPEPPKKPAPHVITICEPDESGVAMATAEDLKKFAQKLKWFYDHSETAGELEKWKELNSKSVGLLTLSKKEKAVKWLNDAYNARKEALTNA